MCILGIESLLRDCRFRGEIVESAAENTPILDIFPDLVIFPSDLLLSVVKNLPSTCVIHYLLLHGFEYLWANFEDAHDHFIYYVVSLSGFTTTSFLGIIFSETFLLTFAFYYLLSDKLDLNTLILF